MEELKAMNFSVESGEKEMDEGYRLLEKYLSNPEHKLLTELVIDYTRVFLGEGVYAGLVASPYASAYIRPRRHVAVAANRVTEVDKKEKQNISEDHISLEFEFMAYLCQETRDALESHDYLGIIGSLLDQKDFLEQHLTNWIPAFCADIRKCAETDFYLAIAKITNGYLRKEQAFLEEFILEVMDEVVNN